MKKSLEKNKDIDGKNEKEPKLETYIKANKEFREYVDQQKDILKTSTDLKKQNALKEIETIADEIQTLINQKIISTF